MSFSSTRMSHFQIRKTYHFQIRKLCLLQIRKCVHFKYENVSLLNTKNVSFLNTRMCHFQIRKTYCGLYVFSNTNVTYFFSKLHAIRWLSVHLVGMFQLEEINTDIATAFKNGMFVVNKTRRKFSSIGIDHAHEQNNRCVKEDGGKY